MSMEDDARPMPTYQSDDPDESDGLAPGGDDDEEGAAPVGGNDQQTLSAGEARVLGCLMEKAQATPEYYPLTMNALVAACNQKSNRDPVVEFDDDQVDNAIVGLREKGFAALISVAGSRVPKYKHTLDLALPALDERGLALLTVLLLRGQQTLGELRTRTERMFHFNTLEAAQESLEALERYPGRKLVSHLPAGGGRRVATFVHLLCGEVEAAPAIAIPSPAVAAGSAPAAPPAWRDEVEAELKALREQVSALRKELDEFKSQFG